MTDLINVLPDFPTSSYSHLLPSLSRNLITTSDLVSLDASHIAKRAQLPPAEVAKLSNAILEALHNQLGVGESKNDTEATELKRNRLRTCEAASISTLDESLDNVLNGGIPTGYLTEVTGER
jgi:DNA repair protein RAD57